MASRLAAEPLKKVAPLKRIPLKRIAAPPYGSNLNPVPIVRVVVVEKPTAPSKEKCPECNASYSSVSCLNRHYRAKHLHGGAAKLICPFNECRLCFTYSGDFQKHLRQEHEVSHIETKRGGEWSEKAKKLYGLVCPTCKGQYRDVASFQKHRCAPFVVPFFCADCKKMFGTQGGLTSHRRSNQCA